MISLSPPSRASGWPCRRGRVVPVQRRGYSGDMDDARPVTRVPARPGEARRTRLLLLATRLARSVGQGALVVDFTLYLRALRWSAVEITALLGGALLVGAVLTLVFGPLSDRLGRRALLLGYEAVQVVAACLPLASAAPWAICTGALLGGFGRGANGAAGPFAPVEQAWLAQTGGRAERGRVFSLNSAAGFAGMGLGALLAALPAWFSARLPGPLAYRPLFALPLLGSLVCLLLLFLADDTEARGRQAPRPAMPPAGSGAVRRQENGLLLRLATANALNGAGVGLTGPVLSYWFAIRFGRGPALIGPMMAVGFLGSFATSLVAGRLAQRWGVVRAVVWMRLLGLALLVALPLSPSFAVAAPVYVLRAVCNRGTSGPRRALTVDLVRPERRGLAATIGSVSMQVPRALAPVLSGLMFQGGLLALPFLAGAGFQAGYLYLYARFFRGRDAVDQ